MNTSHHSELCCLQDAASNGHHAGEQLPRLNARSPCRTDRRLRQPDMEATTATAPTEVKKHQHKHNLKHRYEVMETLGKGTYGKVKKAVERASLKTVSVGERDVFQSYSKRLREAFLYNLKYEREGSLHCRWCMKMHIMIMFLKKSFKY